MTSQVLNASGGAFAAFALVSALFSLGFVVLIIVVVANRAEPDPRGLRPHSVYLFGMSFVTLQLTYAGLILIATSVFSLIAPPAITTKRMPITTSRATVFVRGVSCGAMRENTDVAIRIRPA